MLKVLRTTDASFLSRFRRMEQGGSLLDPRIETAAADILRQVRRGGDRALLALTRRFDGANLAEGDLPVAAGMLQAARNLVHPDLLRAMRRAHRNITRFSLKGRRKDWRAKNSEGALVGEKFDPFHRVGIYVPGGTAPLISTALMTVTLAAVAGCPEIVVCTPCDAQGGINTALLAALAMAGATEVYRLGGAQAIAAMAYGTKTIRRVDKIFGPGNAYVVAAKRLLFGHVSVDLLPGPSEVLILADEAAAPRCIAADLLAQAEHGSGHERVWLLCTSARLIRQVSRQIEIQLPSLPRAAFVRKVLRRHACVIQTRSPDEAIALINRLAPEHCQVMVQSPHRWTKKITTAGALFLGPYSPTVIGDYLAGPSHELPTGGAGRSFSGLTVDQFQRRTSVVEVSRRALARSIESVVELANAEGLHGHGRSAIIRLSEA